MVHKIACGRAIASPTQSSNFGNTHSVLIIKNLPGSSRKHRPMPTLSVSQGKPHLYYTTYPSRRLIHLAWFWPIFAETVSSRV
ncbi:hypothetical protein QL285_060780 [Trifolium repens]|nr:hypothetical protein QL285_060780 [Trifolium repens]